MFTRTKRHSNTAGVSAMALFVLMLGVVLAVVGFGGEVYRALTESQGRNNAARAALRYVSARLRAGDAAGAVTVEQGPEGPALILAEPGYETRIYLYQGTLMEEYAAADTPLDPAAAQVVARTDTFEVTAEGRLYTITTGEGTVRVWLHSGEELP